MRTLRNSRRNHHSQKINTMNINEITIGQLKELQLLLRAQQPPTTASSQPHPMLGRRCLIRTYSAGVHIGTIDYINPANSMELRLKDALRLWKWEGGGLSLSAVASAGIKGGRLNATGEVYLTNAIEIIPVTEAAEATYAKFIE